MRFLAFLLVLLLVAAGLYSGYWFFVAGQIEQVAGDWSRQRAAEGWQVSQSSVDVGGFPGPHRIVLTDLELVADEESGGWTALAPSLDMQAAAPWNFDVWTVRPAREITLILDDGEPATLITESALLTVEAERGALSNFFVEAHGLEIIAETAPLRGADSVFVQGVSTGGDWRVQFEGRSALLSDGAFGDAGSAFGGEIQLLALDLDAGEEGLAALAAGGAGLEDAENFSINAARLEWGAAMLSGEGALGVDSGGRLRGTFDIAVSDAAEFLGALAGASVIGPREANMALAAAAFFPRDDQDRIILPLNFRDGETRLGPVPVGPAPLIYDRNS